MICSIHLSGLIHGNKSIFTYCSCNQIRITSESVHFSFCIAQMPPTSQFESHSASPPTSATVNQIPDALAPLTQPLPAAGPALQYSPVVQHWFYCKIVSGQPTWYPFSHKDSMSLEESFLNGVCNHF